MNIKQFKKKLLYGLIEPELFKMPVEKRETGREPLVFDIYVYGDEYEVSPLTINNLSSITYLSNSQCYVYYNLTDPIGKKVTPETHPDMFHEFPWNDIYNEEGKNSKLSSLLIIPEDCFVHIDWGDGQHSQTTNVQKTIQINSQTYTYTTWSFGDNTQPRHTYKKAGRYTIKVTGNIPNISFNTTYFSKFLTDDNGNYILDENNKAVRVYYKAHLLKIHQWGNLNVRGLENQFRFLFYSDNNDRGFCNKNTFEGMCDYKWNSCDKIVSLYRSFEINYNYFNPETSNAVLFPDYLTWGVLGEDFFKKFPNIINASYMFSGQQGLNYIPRYLFKNNPYLLTISNFTNYQTKPLKYIGEGACKDLHYLTDATICFGGGIGMEIIEDSVFENCYNLKCTGSWILGTVTFENLSPLQKIGKNVFKNCYSIEKAPFYANRSLLLSEIGDGLFENCYSLNDVHALFYNCISLKKVGDNIFKGCKNLQYFYVLFYNCVNLRQLPDNLFYDIENINGDLSVYNFYGMTSVNSWDIYTKKLTSFDWQDRIRNWGLDSYDSDIKAIQKLQTTYPEQVDSLIHSLESFQTIQDLTFRLGKNLFSPNFLQKLQESAYGFDTMFFGWHFASNHSNYSVSVNMMYGEAPPLWKYQTSSEWRPSNMVGNILKSISEPMFGYSQGVYTNEKGTIIESIGEYDNNDEIPVGDPYTWEGLWMQKRQV